MKKKFRFLFLVVAIIGLMAIGQSGNAEDPLCNRPTTFWPETYEKVEGARCMCDGVPNGGRIANCDVVLGGGGDCHKWECKGYVCCHLEADPN